MDALARELGALVLKVDLAPALVGLVRDVADLGAAVLAERGGRVDVEVRVRRRTARPPESIGELLEVLGREVLSREGADAVERDCERGGWGREVSAPLSSSVARPLP